MTQQPDQQETPEQKQKSTSASLEEEYQLLSGKVDDQYQTKVESASKYRVRLSGIVLMNLFSNQGVVDNIDLPTLAYRAPGRRFRRKFRSDASPVGDRFRGLRTERRGREDQSRSCNSIWPAASRQFRTESTPA